MPRRKVSSDIKAVAVYARRRAGCYIGRHELRTKPRPCPDESRHGYVTDGPLAGTYTTCLVHHGMMAYCIVCGEEEGG